MSVGAVATGASSKSATIRHDTHSNPARQVDLNATGAWTAPTVGLDLNLQETSADRFGADAIALRIDLNPVVTAPQTFDAHLSGTIDV